MKTKNNLLEKELIISIKLKLEIKSDIEMYLNTLFQRSKTSLKIIN